MVGGPGKVVCVQCDSAAQIRPSDLQLLFGLNACYGRDQADTQPGNFSNIEAFFQFITSQPWFNASVVHGFEYGNGRRHSFTLPRSVYRVHSTRTELNFGGNTGSFKYRVDPVRLGKDVVTLKGLIRQYFEPSDHIPILVAPDDSPSLFDNYIERMLEGGGGSVLDGVTYHQYLECLPNIFGDTVLDPNCLDGDGFAYEMLHSAASNYNVSLWFGEGALLFDGGIAGITNTWISSLWYVDALGFLAKLNTTSVQRQCLVGGDYGLLDAYTYLPYPDFWVGAMFHRLMSERVLNASLTAMNASDGSYLRAYAHCSKTTAGAATLLLINLHKTTAASVVIQAAGAGPGSNWKLWMVAPTGMEQNATSVELNGDLLQYAPGPMLPPLEPKAVASSSIITVPPMNVAFLEVKAEVGCA